MVLRLSTALLAFVALSSADVLTLRSGRTVEGQYLGGDTRQIRMAIGQARRCIRLCRARCGRLSGERPAGERHRHDSGGKVARRPKTSSIHAKSPQTV